MWKIYVFAVFCILWAVNILEADKIYDFDLDGNEVEELNNIDKASCNYTLDKKSGSFRVSVDKTKLKSGFFCYWNIISNKNASGPVILFFNYLFLDESDEVYIYQDKNFTDSIITKPIKAQNGSVTVFTGLSDVIVTLEGVHPNYIRHFEGYFTHEDSCPVPPDVEIIHSPIYAKTAANDSKCKFTFGKIQHMRAQQVFTFKEFNMSNSPISIEGGTISGEITNAPPEDFFLDGSDIMTLNVEIKKNSSDYFTLHTHLVDTDCSGIREVADFPITLISPKEILNNIVTECRWLLKHKDLKKILGLKFNTLNFHSVFDLVAVNDGLSEISSPLMQVTLSTRNSSQNQIIRSDKGLPYLWVTFKPLNYASQFSATVTSHSNGGYMKNSGTVEMTSADKDDSTIFLLEVNKDEIVKLIINDFSILPPCTIEIYDGFDYSNLLTTLHRQVKFPVFSKSSKMMIIGKKFGGNLNKFSAHFKGVISGCDHMSTLSTENYILSENCNSTCTWILAPQNSTNTELVFNFQYVSLKENDQLEIYKLDENLTQLCIIFANVTHVPHLAVPANVGALIKVTQGACQTKKDKIVLIGHSNIIPDCNQSISLKSSDKFQISSPLYPDTYPLFTTCQWNISTSKNSFFHMTFQNMKLAEGHCVRIYQNSSKAKYEYDGKMMPDDLLLSGDVLVQFDSSECNKKHISKSLNTDIGFLLNVTVADCGGVLEGKKSGEFNTNVSGSSKSLCIWKIDVYENNSVNIISYSVNKKDALENYELTVYDGPSTRDSKIVNVSNSNIWSRSSTLIFVYKRLNVSQPSSVLVFKYETFSCNKSMLCENKVCMHPDWRCNGVNDCGDFTDERNCKSVPIPPNEDIGYSAVSFGLCTFAMLLIGIIVGLLAPICYQKYKDSRYTQFRELSGIDG